ncbi:MAG: hypothetical protein AAF490_19845 [Chloroflexota bacterium]
MNALTLVQKAQEAAEKLALETAVSYQKQAIAILYQTNDLQNVAAQLFNLAGYLQDAGRYDEAVVALREVVEIDQRLGLPDLDQDQAMLKRAEQLAAMSPDERAALEAESLKYLDLTPEERQREMALQIEQGLRQIAEQVTQTAVYTMQSGGNLEELVSGLETAVARIAYDESLGPTRAALVTYLRAVIDCLQNKPPRAVAENYAVFLAQISGDF